METEKLACEIGLVISNSDLPVFPKVTSNYYLRWVPTGQKEKKNQKQGKETWGGGVERKESKKGIQFEGLF